MSRIRRKGGLLAVAVLLTVVTCVGAFLGAPKAQAEEFVLGNEVILASWTPAGSSAPTPSRTRSTSAVSRRGSGASSSRSARTPTTSFPAASPWSSTRSTRTATAGDFDAFVQDTLQSMLDDLRSDLAELEQAWTTVQAAGADAFTDAVALAFDLLGQEPPAWVGGVDQSLTGWFVDVADAIAEYVDEMVGLRVDPPSLSAVIAGGSGSVSYRGFPRCGFLETYDQDKGRCVGLDGSLGWLQPVATPEGTMPLLGGLRRAEEVFLDEGAPRSQRISWKDALEVVNG